MVLIIWNLIHSLIWLLKSFKVETIIKASLFLSLYILYLLHGAHGISMPNVQSSFGNQNQRRPSESSYFSPPSLGRLGWSAADSPALSYWRHERHEGPERNLQRARRRWRGGGGGRRRGSRRGEESERGGPCGGMRGWLGRSGRGKGWGCCEGRDPVDSRKSCRCQDRRRGRLTTTQGGKVEVAGCLVASYQG